MARPAPLARSLWAGSKGILLGLGLVVLAASFGGSPAAVRGPYLQLATPESQIVRWRTDQPTNSRVRFGTNLAGLDQQVETMAMTTEHVVVLSGLLPGTTYFYAVGSSAGDLAGGDVGHFFRTPPPVGSRGATRVWVLGDSGTGDANAAMVRDAFEGWNQGRRVDLWLMLGDNAYTTGTDAEYQSAVFDMYPTFLRTTVLWPTLGNHDGGSADSGTQTGPYYENFSLPALGEAGGIASGTEAYYSFDYANIHFICLNSYDVAREPGAEMATWLSADLAANVAEWTITYWHHPPYTKGSHDSDVEIELVEMREDLMPLLEAGGVDLVLAGHSHAYERSVLIDGHYGTSGTLDASMVLDPGDGRPGGDGAYHKASTGAAPHLGTVAVVAGTSARLGGGSLDHPVMALAFAELGSLVLDIRGRRLDATFVSAGGLELDTFTILKAGIGIFADGFESGGLGAWSGSSP